MKTRLIATCLTEPIHAIVPNGACQDNNAEPEANKIRFIGTRAKRRPDLSLGAIGRAYARL
jgi:hypothetical protein